MHRGEAEMYIVQMGFSPLEPCFILIYSLLSFYTFIHAGVHKLHPGTKHRASPSSLVRNPVDSDSRQAGIRATCTNAILLTWSQIVKSNVKLYRQLWTLKQTPAQIHYHLLLHIEESHSQGPPSAENTLFTYLLFPLNLCVGCCLPKKILHWLVA